MSYILCKKCAGRLRDLIRSTLTLRERYIEQLKIYKRSPEYQQYLVEKNKVLANTSTPAMCEPEIDVASLRNVNNEVRNFTKTWYSIEPFEDQNDEDDPLSIRSIALHRYERNNVYINEIFDESNVASLLRKQNRNIKYINDKLNIQKTNIENDIENEKSKFAERQSRAQERSLKFSENLNKFLQFKITVEDEQKMFENEFLFLQKKWEEHRQRQQLNSSSIQPTQQPPTSSFQQQMTQSDKYFQPQQQQSVVPTSNLPACPQQNKLLLIQDQAKQPAFDYVRQQQQQLHQAIMTSHNNTNEGQSQPQQLMRQGYRQICPPNYNPRQATMNFHSQMHQHYRIPASDVLTVDTAQQQQHQQQYNFIQTSNSHNFYQQPVATQRPISASAAMYSTHSQPSGAHHSHQINPYCYIPISQQHRTSQHQQPNSQQHVYQCIVHESILILCVTS
ncbi:hypothetical protein GJ496_008812 [Pomphorhynchus laevis]|nr:hypothetical protein GJ496_008812 [Pomphorhynchus laevis]